MQGGKRACTHLRVSFVAEVKFTDLFSREERLICRMGNLRALEVAASVARASGRKRSLMKRATYKEGEKGKELKRRIRESRDDESRAQPGYSGILMYSISHQVQHHIKCIMYHDSHHISFAGPTSVCCTVCTSSCPPTLGPGYTVPRMGNKARGYVENLSITKQHIFSIYIYIYNG